MSLALASPSAAARPEAGGWVYLGKDAARREALTARLGPPAPLGGAVHAEAGRLRRPFLDLIARLGKDAPDPEAWWAGTLPWKDWDASDLLLLCSYQALCLRWLAAPAGAPRPSLVVVEDPWLLESLRRAAPDAAGASFRGTGFLVAERLRWGALGVLRRLRWLARTAVSLLVERSLSAGRPPEPVPDGAVALYSHLLERSLATPGRWDDPYLPGLDAELRAAGVPVRRFTYTDATGFEERLASLGPEVVSTLRFARWLDLARGLLRVPPNLPAGQSLEGAPVDLLLERERWWDLSRAGRPAYLLFRACVGRLLAGGRWKAVVFPWENQPQERMLILAARAAGVRTVGYQHTTLPRFQPAFFLGEGEDAWSPLPDRLVASGPYPLRLLRESGYADGRLVLGGSRRYPGWSQAPAGSTPQPPRADALIVIPLEAPAAEQLLAAVRRAWPDGPSGWRLRTKAHPASGRRTTGPGIDDEPASASLAESLERSGPVVYCGSTSGLEALRAGHPVLRFRPESLLPVDPADFLGDDALPTATGDDLAGRLEALRGKAPAPGPATRTMLAELFSPPDPAAWRKAVLEAP